MIIDSHVHFWKYDRERDGWMNDMPVLQKDHLPAVAENVMKENCVDGCIAVQAAQSEEETFFLVKLAAENNFVKAVVGWVDIQSDNIEERLDHFSRQAIIKGWRHIVQAEEEGFLSGESFRRGIKAMGHYNYVYDLLIHEQQLQEVNFFLSAFPDQVFVLDHCGKPNISGSSKKNWEKEIKEAARHPKLYCKLSGLLTEATWHSWKPEDIYPYIDIVFEAFGCDRILFGSDWPVLNVAGNYRLWKELVSQYILQFSKEDQQKIWGLNAVKIYSLPGSESPCSLGDSPEAGEYTV